VWGFAGGSYQFYEIAQLTSILKMMTKEYLVWFGNWQIGISTQRDLYIYDICWTADIVKVKMLDKNIYPCSLCNRITLCVYHWAQSDTSAELNVNMMIGTEFREGGFMFFIAYFLFAVNVSMSSDIQKLEFAKIGFWSFINKLRKVPSFLVENYYSCKLET